MIWLFYLYLAGFIWYAGYYSGRTFGEPKNPGEYAGRAVFCALWPVITLLILLVFLFGDWPNSLRNR